MNDGIPSTSDANSEAINETLENFAQALKLTKTNVKDIIYHIITDHDLYATLLGYDKQNAPHLKLTRSKWREIQQSVQAKLDFQLRPVATSSTFLNQEFNEDDDDPDYMPLPSPVADRRDMLRFERNYRPERESKTLMFDSNPFDFDLDYYNFINDTLHDNLYADDDVEDIEYDIRKDLEDDDDDDYFEYKNDKSTKVSKEEMADLWRDFEIDVQKHSMNLNPPLPSPCKRMDQNTSPKNGKRNLRFILEDVPSTSKDIQYDDRTSTSPINIEITEEDPLTVPQHSESADVFDTERIKGSKTKSCCLYQRPLQITKKEWKIIQQQADILVQLLAQTCLITVNKEDNLNVGVFNDGTNCLTTLVHEARKGNPIFQNTLVEEAYNLVFDYQEKDPKIMNIPELSFQKNPTNERGDDLPHCIKYAISISKVFKYPTLFFGQKNCATKKDFFSSGEQMLLALGLKYFEKFKLARRMNEYGKYQRINEYLLPFRTCLQIRVHIKNVRKSQFRHSKLGKILVAAADNNWNPDVNPIFFNFKRSDYLPIDWSKSDQPRWLQNIAECRIYRKYADCILGSTLVRHNKMVPATSYMLGGDYLNPVILNLNIEDNLPKERFVKDPNDNIIRLTNILTIIPNALDVI